MHTMHGLASLKIGLTNFKNSFCEIRLMTAPDGLTKRLKGDPPVGGTAAGDPVETTVPPPVGAIPVTVTTAFVLI